MENPSNLVFVALKSVFMVICNIYVYKTPGSPNELQLYWDWNSHHICPSRFSRVCFIFFFFKCLDLAYQDTHEETRRTEMWRVSISGDKSYFLVGSTSNRILLLKSRLSDVIRINTDGPPNIFSFYKKYVVEFVENSSSPKFLLMSKSVKEKKRCSSGWTRNNQFV